VLASRPILFKTPSLMSELEGASYRVRFPAGYLAEAGLTPEALIGTLSAHIPELLGREHVLVRRQSEDKAREFDARPSIVAIEPRTEETPPALDAHIRFTPRAAVRPEELVAILLPSGDVRTLDVERIALWTEAGGRRLDPLGLLGPRS
jgi:hypothetical protein